MAEVLKKFGRYFLLDHVAQGGMAEIYRARLASPDGAGRILVIKRIQAGFGANSEFIQMFRSEIKVTMGFNHPNIVQLYDFGEEPVGQPYIAMEFVDGRNLKQFLTRCNELKQSFPVELASYIIEQAAAGLHYAHCFKDKISNQPLNIVHRDISPQNILLAYEGNIKVIDFGIAKATTNMENTRAGVIKGKPSYLSPEQISGEPLDGRCDVFALGIVLWEMLVGKKLFAGENDLAVLKLIESCNTHVKPPSTHNPKVPKELDYIVLRALAKQRDRRFQTAEELQRALHKFLYAFNPEFNPGDLSYYAKDLFKNQIVDDRKSMQKLNERAEELLNLAENLVPKPTQGALGSQDGTPKREDTTTVVGPRLPSITLVSSSKTPKLELESQHGSKSSLQQQQRRSASTGLNPAQSRSGASAQNSNQQRSYSAAPPQKTQGSSNFARNAGITAAAVVALVVIGPEFGIEIPIVSEVFSELTGANDAQLILNGKSQKARIQVNGKVVANQLPTKVKGLPVGTQFELVVSGESGDFKQEVTLRKGEKKSISVAWTSAPSQSPLAVQNPAPSGNTFPLRLVFLPSGSKTSASLNGKPVDMSNPLLHVPLDAPLELVAERSGYKSKRVEFVIPSHQAKGLLEWPLEVPLEPLQFGYLSIRTTPSAEAKIMVDGETWVRKTPIENEKLPVGSYVIQLENNLLGMQKRVPANIVEGKALLVDERLEIK